MRQMPCIGVMEAQDGGGGFEVPAVVRKAPARVKQKGWGSVRDNQNNNVYGKEVCRLFAYLEGEEPRGQ